MKISCVGLRAAVHLVIARKIVVEQRCCRQHLRESHRRFRDGYFGEELPSLLYHSLTVNNLEDLGAPERPYVPMKILLMEYIV